MPKLGRPGSLAHRQIPLPPIRRDAVPAVTADDLSALMSRVAAGDREALRQLYQATSSKLFGVCL
ncbi:MAG: hypothetical protein U1E24_00630, partial [Phenylobacterium sp.]|nr:hypothetical protein [Phenylobacterium sp.]